MQFSSLTWLGKKRRFTRKADFYFFLEDHIENYILLVCFSKDFPKAWYGILLRKNIEDTEGKNTCTVEKEGKWEKKGETYEEKWIKKRYKEKEKNTCTNSMSQVIPREGRWCACAATPTVSNIRFAVSYCGCGFFLFRNPAYSKISF